MPHKQCMFHGFIIAIRICGEYYKFRCAILKVIHPQMTRNRHREHSGMFLTTVISIALSLVSLKVSACRACYLLNVVLFFINCMLTCFLCVIENIMHRVFLLENSNLFLKLHFLDLILPDIMLTE